MFFSFSNHAGRKEKKQEKKKKKNLARCRHRIRTRPDRTPTGVALLLTVTRARSGSAYTGAPGEPLNGTDAFAVMMGLKRGQFRFSVVTDMSTDREDSIPFLFFACYPFLFDPWLHLFWGPVISMMVRTTCVGAGGSRGEPGPQS